ncbi:AP-1 complex subunit sigma-3 [Rana temporaria]|uniref:AP-1 complex subunit sigma-3 n=1 Tax=Rana temporaria TaxID=8407 RepID=UPI001AAC5F26|nr:AP-1 complex subunit sigma-3 [Rana temporaria]
MCGRGVVRDGRGGGGEVAVPVSPLSLSPVSSFSAGIEMIRFLLLFSRQGKLRLQKWYVTLPEKEKRRISRELMHTILCRSPKTSSFIDWKDLKLVYKRYASLYFCCAIEDHDNELLTLETVHRLVELLDKYFGNVCELDIIFNFEKAYFILDEFLMGGEIQETSKEQVVRAIEDSDMLQETMEEYMSKPTF